MSCECNCQPCVASEYYISHIVIRLLINMKQLLILLNKKNKRTQFAMTMKANLLHMKIYVQHI